MLFLRRFSTKSTCGLFSAKGQKMAQSSSLTQLPVRYLSEGDYHRHGIDPNNQMFQSLKKSDAAEVKTTRDSLNEGYIRKMAEDQRIERNRLQLEGEKYLNIKGLFPEVVCDDEELGDEALNMTTNSGSNSFMISEQEAEDIIGEFS